MTFDIDANGILNVTAKDQASGRSQSITISGSTRLADDDKQRMINEAEKYTEQDKQRREQADTLNEADATCYQGEKMLADFSDKLTADMKQRIEQGIRDTHEALGKHDAALAKQQAEVLTKVLKEAGVAIYAQTPDASRVYKEHKAAGSDTGGSPSAPRKGARVVDADYEETH